MDSDDDFCQECEKFAVFMFLTDEYCDRFYCHDHAIEHLVHGNFDDPKYDWWSAEAALQSMILEGSVTEL